MLGRPGGRPPRPVDSRRDWGEWLRCSAVPEDGPHGRSPTSRPASSSCDARPSRRTAATTATPARRGPAPGCDARPSRRTAATTTSAMPEMSVIVAMLGRPGGRPPPARTRTRRPSAMPLRCSAVPEDGRHLDPARHPLQPGEVAMLGRPGGRPPHGVYVPRIPSILCCDARPSRRTAATRSCGVGCDHASRLRCSAVPEDGRHAEDRPHFRRPRSSSCDARPSRRTAATPGSTSPTAECLVAMLGRPGGRPPPDAGDGDAASAAVAMLGRPGGRPPHPRPPLDPGRTCCDARPSRRTAATQARAGGVRPTGRCDARPSRRTAATPAAAAGGRPRLVAMLGRPGGRPPQRTAGPR